MSLSRRSPNLVEAHRAKTDGEAGWLLEDESNKNYYIEQEDPEGLHT